MFIAKTDFKFGKDEYKKGQVIHAIPGTSLFKWLCMPGNSCVESAKEAKPELPTIEPAVNSKKKEA